jgi:nucleoside-diphosphate-sugar epimerase
MVSASAHVVSAAQKMGAQILFPGNVYGLGEQTGHPLPERAENAPTTRKGELRVRLEHALATSVREGVARVIIVRGGDFFGPTVRNGLVDPIFGNAVRGRPIVAIGNPGIPHQWVYLPDLARVSIDLLEIAGKLDSFEVVHFAGYVPRTYGDFLRYVADEAGHPGLRIEFNPFWWRWRSVVGLFVPVLRELAELAYLFEDSVILDDPRRRELLPVFQPTPIDMAVRKTLDSYLEEAA